MSCAVTLHALTLGCGLPELLRRPEPHASSAEKLSRTKLVGALSAGQGSAVAFVSTWPDYVSIDHVVVSHAEGNTTAPKFENCSSASARSTDLDLPTARQSCHQEPLCSLRPLRPP